MKLFRILFVLALLLASARPAAASPAISSPRLSQLMQKAQASGSLAVLVGLNFPFQAAASLDSAAASAQQAALSRVQDGLLARLPGYDTASVKKFHFIPALALRVIPGGLAALAADPAVSSLVEDKARPISLAESVPLIGAPAAWAEGYSGAGQVVAILDTGVDKNHPFLAGKVVSEACYSTTSSADGAHSICPGGAASSTAVDSALPYQTGVCAPGLCNHGTHVAGIAAGRTNGANPGFSGVAKDASLIAIQIFSEFIGGPYCSGTCVLSYDSDMILGLQRVFELHSSYAIAAVNLSLGSDSYTDQVSCDAANPQVKAAIDSLRSVGIATVIASGNNGSGVFMNAPACISSAISVGSVGDGSGGAVADVVSSFSNTTSFLSLLAPGAVITSSIPNGFYGAMQGTSMAAPHVAGAWAVLKSKYPAASVTQVLAAFKASGKLITDSRNHVVTPRIQVDAALVQTYSAGGKVTLGSGSGAPGLGGVSLSADSQHATTSAADGSYTLGGLVAGSYTLTASKEEYTFTLASQPVSLGPNQAGVDFSAVQNTYAISGQVLLSGGSSGLAQVTVRDGAGHSTLTDSNGNYSLDGLVKGTYTLTLTRFKYWFDPNPVPVSVGPSQPGINFTGVFLPISYYWPMIIVLP